MKHHSLLLHLSLLAVFCIAIAIVWMLPVLLAGFPFGLPYAVHYVRELAETGLVSSRPNALLSLLLWPFHGLIDWQNMTGWTAVGAGFLAAALVPWWWSVRRLFDARIAWIATIVLAFMPMYWVEAVQLGGYAPAFFFLFLGFALFIEVHPRNAWAGTILAGICFGLTMAASHAFFTFLPWFALAYCWFRRHHLWSAVLQAGLYCAVAYAAFVAPLLPNALQSGMTPSERLAVFLPAPKDHMTGVYHLYPDEYTYEFLREEFEQKQLRTLEQGSFLVRQDNQNYRYIFGVGDLNLRAVLTNSIWLFANAIPQLFLMENIGGVFLWLFILPGMALLYRRNRRLLYAFIGLWLCMELVLRFGFHFSRNHLMNTGWILALLAAVGIDWAGQRVRTQWQHVPALCAMAVITTLVSAQLVQANRMLFARLYAKSNVPAAYAVAAALEDVPEDAVIAYPRNKAETLFFVRHTSVNIHNATIDSLSEKQELHKPLEHYGITHILGYDAERAELILNARRDIELVEFDEEEFIIPLTPFRRLLLHAIR
ncbi:hypothetical protein GX553_03225 [Candidatus Peribacteria bacterium]|nr:hypothetical protein [Candidatus Peribacteria bacterium]